MYDLKRCLSVKWPCSVLVAAQEFPAVSSSRGYNLEFVKPMISHNPLLTSLSRYLLEQNHSSKPGTMSVGSRCFAYNVVHVVLAWSLLIKVCAMAKSLYPQTLARLPRPCTLTHRPHTLPTGLHERSCERRICGCLRCSSRGAW